MSLRIEVLSSFGKELMIVESEHKIDSKIVFFLEKNIKEFKPDTILVEGNFDIANYKDANEAINFGGDMGFVTYLAKKNGIAVLSNDPPFEEDIDFLKKEYDKEFSFVYFFLRKKSLMIEMKEYISHKSDEEIIYNFSQYAKWNNFEFSSVQINKAYKRIFGTDMEEKAYSDYFNPTLDINVFNEATKKLNKFRDEYMIKILRNIFKIHKKVFLIKGSYHIKTNLEKIKDVLNE